MSRKTIAKIACPGSLADHLVIEMARSECGDVDDGIGVRFEGNGGCPDGVGWDGHGTGFVMSWPDFEAAYLKVKSIREGSPSEGPGSEE